MEWGYQQFFPCGVSPLMVVDGSWAPGLNLNLTRDTLQDTWLFILSLGSQSWLPATNCPISPAFPPFRLFFFVFLISPPAPMVPSGCHLLLSPLALPVDLSSIHWHWTAIALPHPADCFFLKHRSDFYWPGWAAGKTTAQPQANSSRGCGVSS